MLARIEVRIHVEGDVVEAVLVVHPLDTRVVDSVDDCLLVLRIFMKNEIELRLLKSLVSVRELLADLLDHLFDAEVVEVAVVAAVVVAFV